MADRVSATITLGGVLARSLLGELLDAIASDGPTLEYHGPPFDVANLVDGQPLTLVAAEVAWGRFDAIEACCRRLGLAYARWSGGCVGSFLPEREVFAGTGEPDSFLVTEHDELVFTYEHVRSVGSIAAITAEVERANAVMPPLVLVGDGDPDGAGQEAAS